MNALAFDRCQTGEVYLSVADDQVVLFVDLVQRLPQVLVLNIAQIDAGKDVLEQAVESLRVAERQLG